MSATAPGPAPTPDGTSARAAATPSLRPGGSFRVAAIQAAPHYLDVEASLRKACRLIEQAAATGAVVAAFSESWLPGYPFFLFSGISHAWWQAAERYLAASIAIPGPETDVLCETARRCNIDVVIGVVERETRTDGSLYCTVLFIGNDGSILGRHRKTRATLHERSVWADGDAQGLVVHSRPYARISALCCWEHNTVLPGYALIQQGTQLHFSLWPGREPHNAPPSPESLYPRQLLLSRAFASQAAAYVVCVGGLRRRIDVPERFAELQTVETEGHSFLIDPRGEVMAGPAQGETVLTGDCDLGAVRAAKVACDAAGHYLRGDLFEFSVRRGQDTPMRT